MHEIGVDLADDRFEVTFDPDRVSAADFLRTIRGLDYEPELVEPPTEPTVVAERIDTATLPEDLRALFVKAKAEDRPVLVEFSGPG